MLYISQKQDTFKKLPQDFNLVEKRSRWKIENEHNNTLKTKGYNLEHNFGHGKENLSNLLITLNILAFLFHTILEYLDRRYALIRKILPRRTTFYNDLRALTRYFCFRHWKHLMLFMLKGLELVDPGGQILPLNGSNKDNCEWHLVQTIIGLQQCRRFLV